MSTGLLSLHVLGVILTVGPVAVAASMFPAVARRAEGADAASRDAGNLGALSVLHRICRVYAAVAVVVPVFGLATASSRGVFGAAWLTLAIALTAAAAGVLVLLVLPYQDRLLAAAATPPPAPEDAAVPSGADRRARARLAMYAGMFNLLWVAVAVLMVVKPSFTVGTGG